jgi:hypothetical protein
MKISSYSYQILLKFEFSRQIIKKYQKMFKNKVQSNSVLW